MKQKILEILERELSNAKDNLYRCEAKFKGYTTEGMDTKYGDSGSTCAEIVHSYKRPVTEILACIEWVEHA